MGFLGGEKYEKWEAIAKMGWMHGLNATHTPVALTYRTPQFFLGAK